ncbi:MAG: helix-turn-helix domain-containing protein [Sulfuricaulis sp.]
MGRHSRGERVVGTRVRAVRDPNVRAIRRKTGLSQSGFASLIGVNVRTLQNWEQGRTRPAPGTVADRGCQSGNNRRTACGMRATNDNRRSGLAREPVAATLFAGKPAPT